MTATQTSPEMQFTAFVATSGPGLRRTARLLVGDEHRAEELVQQTLVKTYLAWPRAQATDPEAYARRVLANQRIDTWRKHRREVLTDPSEVPDTAMPSDAEAAADRDEVVRALLTLTPRQRRVVVLRHLVGMTDAEVAADLGVSVGTVKSTSSRALAQLRGAFAPGRSDPDDVPARLRTALPADEPARALTGSPSAADAIRGATTIRRRRRALATSAVAVVVVVGLILTGRLLTGTTEPVGGVAADWPVYGSLDALAEQADLVVAGTVLDERHEDIDIDLGPAVDPVPCTVYRVDVTDTYVGDAAAGDVVEVAVMDPANRPTVEPRLEVGAPYVLFLAESFDGRPRFLLNPFEAVYRVAPDGTLVSVSTDEQLSLSITLAELEALRSVAP